MLTVRSGIGARHNALDNQERINDSLLLQIQSTRSEIEDLDYAEAAFEMSLSLLPGNASVMLNAAELQTKRGRRMQALGLVSRLTAQQDKLSSGDREKLESIRRINQTA